MWMLCRLGHGMSFDDAWPKNFIGKLSVPSKNAAQHWCRDCSSTLFLVVLKTADSLWVIIASVWNEEMRVSFCLVKHEYGAVISSWRFCTFFECTCVQLPEKQTANSLFKTVYAFIFVSAQSMMFVRGGEAIAISVYYLCCYCFVIGVHALLFHTFLIFLFRFVGENFRLLPVLQWFNVMKPGKNWRLARHQHAGPWPKHQFWESVSKLHHIKR